MQYANIYCNLQYPGLRNQGKQQHIDFFNLNYNFDFLKEIKHASEHKCEIIVY